MRKLTLNKEYSSVENYHNLISGFIDELKVDSFKNKKKIIELCHIGKFLMFFDNQYKIEKVCEEPDFIITNGKNIIGLEHQVLIDSKSKEREGFFNNLIKLSEKELRKDTDLPNFLANVYVNPYFQGKINKKQELVKEISQIVKIYIQTGKLIESEIIDRISSMKHSQISLSPIMGAWRQKEINEDLIKNAIKKKEKKIDNYLKNTHAPQWLLIVIGSLGESSYQIENEFDLTIETKFNKVYVMEDFSTNLYEMK